jgi:hypothetical protein
MQTQNVTSTAVSPSETRKLVVDRMNDEQQKAWDHVEENIVDLQSLHTSYKKAEGTFKTAFLNLFDDFVVIRKMYNSQGKQQTFHGIKGWEDYCESHLGMSKGYVNSLLKAEEDRRAGREPKPKVKATPAPASGTEPTAAPMTTTSATAADEPGAVPKTEEVDSPVGSDAGSDTATDAGLPAASEPAAESVKKTPYTVFMAWLTVQPEYNTFIADETHVLRIKPYEQVTRGSDVVAGDYFIVRRTDKLSLFHQNVDKLTRWAADKKDWVVTKDLPGHIPVLVVSFDDAEAEFPEAFTEPEDVEGEE